MAGWEKCSYTGKCSKKTKKQNNQLLWLRKRSTALFPSVYLTRNLRNSPHAKLYVRNIVREALRVGRQPKRPYTVPIYIYSRPVYRDRIQNFQTQVSQFEYLSCIFTNLRLVMQLAFGTV